MPILSGILASPSVLPFVGESIKHQHQDEREGRGQSHSLMISTVVHPVSFFLPISANQN